MAGCLIGLFVGILIIVLSFVLNIFRLVFGVKDAARRFMGTDSEKRRGPAQTGNANSQPGNDGAHRNSQRQQGRFFDKNEGDYVDFEEIKE